MAICQVDGAAVDHARGHGGGPDDPASVAEAERRYAARYRHAAPQPGAGRHRGHRHQGRSGRAAFTRMKSSRCVSNFEADPEVGPELRSRWSCSRARRSRSAGRAASAVTRTLPNRQRRMVGAWCFLDAYGPHELGGSAGMRVGPHPHTGLQTVTWLVAGRDAAPRQPGQPCRRSGRAAQPDDRRPGHRALRGDAARAFRRCCTAYSCGWPCRTPTATWPRPSPTTPIFRWSTDGGLTATVLMGTLGRRRPRRRGVHTPLVGAELTLAAGARLPLPLQTRFRVRRAGARRRAEVDGATLKPGPLLYLGRAGRTRAAGHRRRRRGCCCWAASRSRNGW